eukprot:jgi/Picsp_1/4833/NSC_02200-R1_protein
MDFHNVMKIVEQACQGFLDPSSQPQAEKTLQDFRQSPQPYESCKYIIDNSLDPSAQFQAIKAIRDAFLREWDTVLSLEGKIGLIQYMVSRSISTDRDRNDFVMRQMSACAATLMKRIWGEVDPTFRESILANIAAFSTADLSMLSRSNAINVLLAIVVEFNPLTASEMGLPWDYHYHCKNDLEAHYLPQILRLALKCAQSSTGPALHGSDQGLCSSSLSLIGALLSWDSSKQTKSNKCERINTQITPPKSWGGILLEQDNENGKRQLEFLSSLLSGILSISECEDTKLLNNYLELLVVLCSMDGHIFKENKRDEHPQNAFDRTKAGHIFNMLQLCIPVLLPTEDIIIKLREFGPKSDLILGSIRALVSLVSTHRTRDFVQAISCEGWAGFQGSKDILRALSSVTEVLVLESRSKNELAAECADMLIEVWMELSIESNLPGIYGCLHDEFCQHLGKIFLLNMEKEIFVASMDIHLDEEEYEGEEEAYSEALQSYLATIGRASFKISLPALQQGIEKSREAMKSLHSQGKDTSMVLEELCWLIRITSCILADDGDGEVPLIPQIFIESVFEREGINMNCLVSISQSLLKLADETRHGISTGMVSSRFMEELCMALGRWADTYLLSEERHGHLLMDFKFGRHQDGPSTTNFLVELSLMCFSMFPGERTLHLSVCNRLLKKLSRYDTINRVLIRCPAWNELYHSYLIENGPLACMEAEVYVHLSMVVCLSSGGFVHESEASQYLHAFVECQSGRLMKLSNLGKDELERPDNVLLLLNVLGSMQGVARSSQVRYHRFIYSELSKSFVLLLDLFRRSKDRVALYNSILILAADIMEYHGTYLEYQDLDSLLSWAVELIKFHISQKIASSSKCLSFISPSLEDECDSLVALLRLLTQVTNAESSTDSKIALTIFEALRSMMPLLTSDHLKIPELRHNFFSLLAYMVEAHASLVLGMNHVSLGLFTQALCYGIEARGDSETEASVFEAVAALANFSLTSARQGRNNLLTPESSQDKSPLLTLWEKIFKRLIFEDPGIGGLDFAAEPALYICSHDPHAFIELLGNIIRQEVGAAHCSDKVLQCLERLEACALEAQPSDRQSRQSFQKQFSEIMVAIRGAVRCQ